MRTLRILGIAFLLLIAGRTAMGQVDLTAWPQVRVEVLAIDSQGNPMAGLTPDALVVKEGKQPLAISTLRPAAEPQSICVLLDAASSMADRLDTVRTKVRRFLRSLPPQDEECLAHYSGGLIMDQRLTQNHNAAVNALAPIEASGAATLRDAMLQLSDYMRGSARNKSRAIVLFSDALDHGSAAGKDQWRQAMETAGTPVVHLVCIPAAFGHAQWKQDDETSGAAMQVTAIGGGLTYFPHTTVEIDGMVDHLSDYLQARYVLTYQAENSTKDGGERRIAISYDKSHRAPKQLVLAPAGYIAPSPQK